MSLAGILILDIARSYHARSAAPMPQAPRGDSTVGKAIAWPPGSDVGTEASLGEQVFARHCAVCHGSDGKGDGPAASSLKPRPRDFTRGAFKFKSTRSIEPPRLDDIRRSIRDGIAGTSMPAWRDLLGAREIDALIEHLRKLGPIEHWTEPGTSEEVSADIFVSADAVRGEKLYSDLSCFACHGEKGRGDGPAAPELRDVWMQPVEARDLTAPWTFRWGSTRAAVYHWIAEGLSGTPMPVYSEVLDQQGIADVVAYIESIARIPPWKEGGSLTTSDDPIQRGGYLVRAGMCGLCHTPVDDVGSYQRETHQLAGGMKIEAGAHGIFFAANLTPDHETGLGGLSEAQIAAALQTGHTRDRRLNYWAMPWQIYGSFTPNDALAIAAYLKSLPAVRNQVPGPLYFGSLESVARKLTYPWPAVTPERLVYAGGNFGRDDDSVDRHTSTQTWLLRGQRLLLLLAAIAWLIARRGPRGEQRHGGASMTAALLVFVGAAAVAFVERYPALGPIPPGPIVGSFSASIPTVPADDPARLLRERGRYLFTTSSCAFCHGGDGHGGNKVNWRGIGTVWSGNLTPDASGLATWSDEDIARVLRSGVRRDGRQIHWQAMPWDSYSSYREEDLRSLIAYVRGIPALPGATHKPLSPSSADCPDYTFWVDDSNSRPGCD